MAPHGALESGQGHPNGQIREPWPQAGTGTALISQMGTQGPGGKGLPLATLLTQTFMPRPRGQGLTVQLSVPLFAHQHNGCASTPPSWAEGRQDVQCL